MPDFPCSYLSGGDLPIQRHTLPKHVLCFFLRQKNADQCRNQDKGRQTDKAPFKGVEDHPHDGGLRDAVIPAQVRAVHHGQDCGHGQNTHAHRNEQPVDGRAPHGLSPGKLQVDDLQLFREGIDLVRFRLRHRLAQQRADWGLQSFRQGDEQIGVRDGQAGIT